MENLTEQESLENTLGERLDVHVGDFVDRHKATCPEGPQQLIAFAGRWYYVQCPPDDVLREAIASDCIVLAYRAPPASALRLLEAAERIVDRLSETDPYSGPCVTAKLERRR